MMITGPRQTANRHVRFWLTGKVSVAARVAPVYAQTITIQICFANIAKPLSCTFLCVQATQATGQALKPPQWQLITRLIQSARVDIHLKLACANRLLTVQSSDHYHTTVYYIPIMVAAAGIYIDPVNT
jgi:hypothetical protein